VLNEVLTYGQDHYGRAYEMINMRYATEGQLFTVPSEIEKEPHLRIAQKMIVLAKLMPILAKQEMKKPRSLWLPCVSEYRALRKVYGKIAPGNAQTQTADEILEAESFFILSLTRIKGVEAGLAEMKDITETPNAFFGDGYKRNIQDLVREGQLAQWKQKTLLKIAEVFAENQLDK
jgi:hypothetical protein